MQFLNALADDGKRAREHLDETLQFSPLRFALMLGLLIAKFVQRGNCVIQQLGDVLAGARIERVGHDPPPVVLATSSKDSV